MGKKIYFRAFETSDLDFINKIRNDKDLFQFTCGNKYYISKKRDIQWIEDKIFNNYKQLYLAVCETGSDDPVGYICATNIDYINRKAQWGGIVIDSKYSGKGYGTMAGKLLLSHLFGELGMNMVYGFWREDHIASIKMAEKIGFSKEGLLRDFVYKQNRYYSAYLYSILKKDFENSNN